MAASFAATNAEIILASCGEYTRAILNRLFDGLEGKLTSSKWAKLAKCPQATAMRNIDDLVKRGV